MRDLKMFRLINCGLMRFSFSIFKMLFILNLVPCVAVMIISAFQTKTNPAAVYFAAGAAVSLLASMAAYLSGLVIGYSWIHGAFLFRGNSPIDKYLNCCARSLGLCYGVPICLGLVSAGAFLAGAWMV